MHCSSIRPGGISTGYINFEMLSLPVQAGSFSIVAQMFSAAVWAAGKT
jgi:hypothetical protein